MKEANLLNNKDSKSTFFLALTMLFFLFTIGLVFYVKTPSKNKVDPFVAINEKIDELDKKSEWNSFRIFVLGVLSNENNTILKNDIDKTELLFLQKDWQLDKQPNYVELDDSDIKYLKKYAQ